MRILLIEDDVSVGRNLIPTLSDAGMSVDWVRDGVAALEALIVGGHTAVLLDLGTTGVEATELLQHARQQGVRTPVLIVTSREDMESKIKRLDLGADDFILKPFELPELLARLRAVVRRHAHKLANNLTTGEIQLDLASHEVIYRGKSDVLPAREFALIRALAERPGAILSRSQLEDRLYGWGEEVESNAIDVLIHYIRRRFDKEIIRNVRGAGWMVLKS